MNWTHRIGFRMFELFRKIDEDFGGSTFSWNTQPNCRLLFSKATALLSPFFWDICYAVHQPGNAQVSTYLQVCIHSRTCRTSILEDAPFHRIGASSFEVVLAGPSRRSTTGTLASKTSGSQWIFHTLLRGRSWRTIRQRRFYTLIHLVSETARVSFHTLPVGFPLPTISKNSLYTLFCSLILNHGVLLKISASGPKVLISNFLFDTSLHHCLQSVIIGSTFLLMNLHITQFQYGLEFLRLSYS